MGYDEGVYLRVSSDSTALLHTNKAIIDNTSSNITFTLLDENKLPEGFEYRIICKSSTNHVIIKSETGAYITTINDTRLHILKIIDGTWTLII